jgi:hypothetical protein
VLERSLPEGAAEFTGEMISGEVAYGAFRASTKGQEKEIESRFAADVDKADLSDWLDNTTPDKLDDLGYLGRLPHCEILLPTRARQTPRDPRDHPDEQPSRIPSQDRLVSRHRAELERG